MQFTVDELLAWAARHESDEWSTLRDRIKFSYRVTGSGIEYTTGTGNRRNVPRKEMEAFCHQFESTRSYSPGKYPARWHKSYSLPLIQRFLQDRD